MKISDRKIWVTFQKEGIHRYPAALDDPNLCTAGEMDKFLDMHTCSF